MPNIIIVRNNELFNTAQIFHRSVFSYTKCDQAIILQSMMNAKLSQHWHENGLIKTVQTIPHNLYVSVKLTSPY